MLHIRTCPTLLILVLLQIEEVAQDMNTHGAHMIEIGPVNMCKNKCSLPEITGGTDVVVSSSGNSNSNGHYK